MESGYNFTYSLWLGLVVRSGTTKAVIQRLSEALKYARRTRSSPSGSAQRGSDPSYTTPEAWTEYLRKEYVDMGKLAADMKYEAIDLKGSAVSR